MSNGLYQFLLLFLFLEISPWYNVPSSRITLEMNKRTVAWAFMLSVPQFYNRKYDRIAWRKIYDRRIACLYQLQGLYEWRTGPCRCEWDGWEFGRMCGVCAWTSPSIVLFIIFVCLTDYECENVCKRECPEMGYFSENYNGIFMNQFSCRDHIKYRRWHNLSYLLHLHITAHILCLVIMICSFNKHLN